VTFKTLFLLVTFLRYTFTSFFKIRKSHQLTLVAIGKNLQSENFYYFFWTPLGSRVSIWINFFFKFILSCQQFDNCFHCLPPVSLTPVANLPPVSTTLAKLVKKFATGVVDTGWCTLTSEYLCEFLKKFKMVLMEYSGAGGKLIHEKNGSKKSRDTVPLSQ
jgi:hypothetical protein